MALRIEVRVDECMSSGKCVNEFPETFGFDDDELAVIIEGGVLLSDHDMLRAARNCPSQALLLFDADGKRVAT